MCLLAVFIDRIRALRQVFIVLCFLVVFSGLLLFSFFTGSFRLPCHFLLYCIVSGAKSASPLCIMLRRVRNLKGD